MMVQQTKACSLCGETKSILEFSKDKRMRSGLKSACKDCLNRKGKAYRLNNRKKIRVAGRKYCAKNRDKKRVYNKKYNSKHRENKRIHNRNYREANPEKMRSKRAKRRARKRNAFVSKVDYEELYERDNGVCHICEKFVDKDDVHVDHIKPLSRGGTHEPSNVAISHSKCNLQKGAAYPI